MELKFLTPFFDPYQNLEEKHFTKDNRFIKLHTNTKTENKIRVSVMIRLDDFIFKVHPLVASYAAKW